MEAEEYRKRAEGFLRELNEEFYRNGAGLKDSLDVSSVFEKYSDLFEKDQVMLLLGAARESRFVAREMPPQRPGPSGLMEATEEEKRARYLAWFAADGFLDMATKELTDAVASGETQAQVEFEGKMIPFRASQVVLANEPSPRARAALETARQQVTRKNNPKRAERMEMLHTLVGELGYPDYRSFCAETRGIDLESLSARMQGFLDDTEGLYTRAMEKAASSILGMRLRDVSRHDLGFLFRGIEFDDMFAGDRVVTTLESTVAAMGLAHEGYPNIHIDAEARERKSPRAFCATLDIPGKIVLVTMPHGGHDDYHSILHEAGHAWHFGSVLPDRAFEYRWLGDNSVTETYAFLFQYLAADENWLLEYVRGPHVDEYRRFAAMRKLFMLRRSAAKLLYELRLHGGKPLADMPQEYAGLLTDALKVRYPESYYLADVDDGFYVAQYLRAWIFEAQLRSFFTQRFGERWYAYPEAGQALRELFVEGQRFSVEELAQKLGMPGLDLNVVSQELADNLKA